MRYRTTPRPDQQRFCCNCIWYQNNSGACRRMPPSTVGRLGESMHPVVDPHDWCGEFTPQETP